MSPAAEAVERRWKGSALTEDLVLDLRHPAGRPVDLVEHDDRAQAVGWNKKDPEMIRAEWCFGGCVGD